VRICLGAYKLTSANDLQLRGLLKRCEVKAGLGKEAFEEAGPVLHPPLG
jgi:hypothetical protein